MSGTAEKQARPSPNPRPDIGNRFRWLRLLAAAAVLAGGIQLALQLVVGVPVIWNNSETRRDVHQLYLHARMVRTDQPLYWSWADYGPDVMTPTRPKYVQQRMPYPPFLTPTLAFLAGLPFVEFQRVWCLLLLGCFWCYAACLARLASGSVSPPWVLGAGAVLASLPGAYGAISVGNVDPMIWALIGLALVFEKMRGAAFSAVALVKLYGIWPIVFALRGGWQRIVLGGGSVIVTAAAISMLALGPQRLMASFVDWMHYMLPVVAQGTFAGENYSVSMGGLRLLRMGVWHYPGGPLPAWARVYLVTVGTVAPIVTGVLLRRRSVPFQTACVVCAATAFGPIFWATYMPLLLAPIAVWLGEQSSGRRATPPQLRQ